MKSVFLGFNTYLVLALVLGAGCKSAEEKKRDAMVATLRLHLEALPDESKKQQRIEILGVPLSVTTEPFLHEANLEGAAVVATVDGGYALRLQFDRHGALMLENVTLANRGKRIGIYSEFGPADAGRIRWLGAPLLAQPLRDGVLIFSPNATRAEADEIALGLNNGIQQTKKQSWLP